VNAPITSVTVLEDRAAVTRRGSVQLAAGQHRIVVAGVAPVLVDKTLTAAAVGARVLDVRCERYLAPWCDPAAASDDAPAALHAERIRLETARDAALGRLAAAQAELAALADVTTAALRELAIAASRASAPPTAATQLAALDADDAAARARRTSAGLAVQDLQAALGRLAERIARAEAEAGEQAARLVIDVRADAPAEVAIMIGYVVPGAAWRPYHRAVLVRAADPGQPASVASISSWRRATSDAPSSASSPRARSATSGSGPRPTCASTAARPGRRSRRACSAAGTSRPSASPCGCRTSAPRRDHAGHRAHDRRPRPGIVVGRVAAARPPRRDARVPHQEPARRRRGMKRA
jgi:hypothetical protein